MKLILDFDDVLFDAKALKELMFEVLREEGVENGEELYEAERRSGRVFLPKEFLRSACASREDDGDTIVEVDVDALYERMMSICPELINQELVALIQSVGRENCYIVSNGNAEFQMDKIARGGVEKLVGHITIVPGSKKAEIEKVCKEFPDEEVVFVDDKNIYFDDLDREVCKNLKTVLYQGEKSLSEIERELGKSHTLEVENIIPGGPMMR